MRSSFQTFHESSNHKTKSFIQSGQNSTPAPEAETKNQEQMSTSSTFNDKERLLNGMQSQAGKSTAAGTADHHNNNIALEETVTL